MFTIPTPRFRACADKAISQSLGKPWKAFANGPDSFDCWGFAEFVYKQSGVAFPHFSTIGTNTERISRGLIQLNSFVEKCKSRTPYSVVLMGSNSSGMGHIGVYHPSGMVYHCLERHGVVGHTPEALAGIFEQLEYWRVK